MSQPTWENFCHFFGEPADGIEMSVDTGTLFGADDQSALKRRPMSPERSSDTLPVSLVHGLLDAVNSSLLVADRDGRVLLLNQRARKYLLSKGLDNQDALNLF